MPMWPLARRARRRPELLTTASVVVAAVGRQSVVVDASPPARRAGVRVGLSLAEARALCPPVLMIDDDPAADARALVALGRWMTRFTPSVATGWPPEPGEPPPPAAVLLLDVTGCERLFGSLDVIVRGVERSLQRFRVPAKVAAAPTPGAAWALALSSLAHVPVGGGRGEGRESIARRATPGVAARSPHPSPLPRVRGRGGEERTRHASIPTAPMGALAFPRADTPTPVGSDPEVTRRSIEPRLREGNPTPQGSACPSESLRDADEWAALSILPVESLRLPAPAVARLRRLGLDTLGHVLAMPRDALPARFGKSLGRRLDQFLGITPELLVPLAYDVPVEAAMSFDGAIDSLETLWLVLRELLGRVCVDLTRRGHGARRIELACAPDPTLRQPPVTRIVHLTRPSRDVNSIFNLLRCAVERLDCGTGFVHVRLRVPLHERTSDEQPALLDDANAAMNERAWEQLVERLSVRLGDGGMVRPVAVESYVPERAWRAAAMTDDPPKVEANALDAPRPLSLLPTPAEVRVIAEPSDDWEGRPAQFTHRGEVHRLEQVIGPERIAGEWWRGHHKTRDYYDVQDERGRRFWLFRVVAPIARASVDGQIRMSTRWFLHGVFAAAIVSRLAPSPPYPGERAGVRG